MTIQEAARNELLKREAQKELARRNLIDFLVYDGGGDYKKSKHIDFMADNIQKAFEGKIRRVIISIPPRHGKSEMITKKAPAWYVGKNPNKEIIMASYSQDMINDFSRIARNTFEEHSKMFGCELARDKQSVNEWGIQGHRGVVKASGIGGGLTGKGAKVAIIDDPHKDWEEAQSKLQRDKVWNWYRSVLRTRLAPDATIILVMTRWHKDDLAGRLIEESNNGGEKFIEIKLKAIADKDDILGREEGEALWEEQFPRSELETIKRAIGSVMWNALYQQSPTNSESGMFKTQYFKYWIEQGNFLHLKQHDGTIKTFVKSECVKKMTVDTASKIKELNDYTVFNAFWITPQNDILFDEILQDKIEIPDQWNALYNFYNRHKPEQLGIEDAQSGTGLIQEAIRQGLPVTAFSSKGDKTTKAATISIYYENGKVYHKENAHWCAKFEVELSGFPFETHDDMVDTASQAGIMVRDAPNRSNRGFGQLKKLKMR